MRKIQILIVLFSLTSAAAVQADQLLNVTLNTSSISGSIGSIDFAFDSGALSSQAAVVQVRNFIGSAFAGTQILTGAATGGPVGAPVSIANSTLYQSNDDFETVRFGSTVSFTLDFSGSAITNPTGAATSTSQFAFYVFSDLNGTIPALTKDPSGVGGLVTVNLNGSLSTSAVSPSLTFVSAVPEPATLWLSAGFLGMFGLSRIRWRYL